MHSCDKNGERRRIMTILPHPCSINCPMVKEFRTSIHKESNVEEIEKRRVVSISNFLLLQ